jgi:hypothetical protein
VLIVVADADAGDDAVVEARDEATDEGALDDGAAREDAPPPPPAETCTNGVDDDGDTLADCADPECDGRTCSGGRTCRSGACGCPGGDTESNCSDGSDNDCDTAVDCADSDCGGRVCGNDGSMCGSTLQCHICSGGACVVNDPHYDASCNPSCGAAQSLCGRPTFCCAAGVGCVGGAPDRSYGCGTCCFDGCCDATETACADGADNDCDTAADCADTDCDRLACATGRCFLGGCCTPDPDPCSWCACGRPDDGCGGVGPNCGRCVAPDTCFDCTCEPGKEGP